jgi:hypothetical protein
MAFERLYGPLGPARDDYLAALIASTVANSLSKKEIPFSQFMPDWSTGPEDAGEVVPDGDGT